MLSSCWWLRSSCLWRFWFGRRFPQRSKRYPCPVTQIAQPKNRPYAVPNGHRGHADAASASLLRLTFWFVLQVMMSSAIVKHRNGGALFLCFRPGLRLSGRQGLSCCCNAPITTDVLNWMKGLTRCRFFKSESRVRHFVLTLLVYAVLFGMSLFGSFNISRGNNASLICSRRDALAWLERANWTGGVSTSIDRAIEAMGNCSNTVSFSGAHG